MKRNSRQQNDLTDTDENEVSNTKNDMNLIPSTDSMSMTSDSPFKSIDKRTSLNRSSINRSSTKRQATAQIVSLTDDPTVHPLSITNNHEHINDRNHSTIASSSNYTAITLKICSFSMPCFELDVPASIVSFGSVSDLISMICHRLNESSHGQKLYSTDTAVQKNATGHCGEHSFMKNGHSLRPEQVILLLSAHRVLSPDESISSIGLVSGQKVYICIKTSAKEQLSTNSSSAKEQVSTSSSSSMEQLGTNSSSSNDHTASSNQGIIGQHPSSNANNNSNDLYNKLQSELANIISVQFLLDSEEDDNDYTDMDQSDYEEEETEERATVMMDDSTKEREQTVEFTSSSLPLHSKNCPVCGIRLYIAIFCCVKCKQYHCASHKSNHGC